MGVDNEAWAPWEPSWLGVREGVESSTGEVQASLLEGEVGDGDG